MASGAYNLEKWRRVLMNIRTKGAPTKNAEAARRRRRPGASGGADKNKLSKIVNNILASKTGEEMNGLVAGSDEERSQNSDNYNIYGD